MDCYDDIKTDDDAVICLLAEAGRHAHEFLLETELVSDGVLKFLASDGANKSIRRRADQRLTSH